MEFTHPSVFASVDASTAPIWPWFLLAAIVAIGLLVDLLGHRGDRGTTRRGAIVWSLVWVSVGLLFTGVVAALMGRSAAEDYLTGFLVEKSLSIDNLFVFLIIFGQLKIGPKEQHRVLAWGVLGAFVIRGAFIAAGVAILDAWHGVVYLLGAFLVYTGIQTVRKSGHEPTGEGKLLGFLRRHLPLTEKRDGQAFTLIENGKRLGTPLLLALVLVELTDVAFSLDSIPAVFAVTKDPFLVYSSNIFAVLGLRALYLVLADVLEDLKFLHYGIAAILVFTGAKMLGSHLVELPHWVSLAAIAGALGTSVGLSLIARRRANPQVARPA